MAYKPSFKPKCWVDSVPVYGGMTVFGNSGVGPTFINSEGDPLF